MKLLSKAQIYEADQLTIEKQQIASTDLMERAGTQVFNWMHRRMQGAQVPIHIFCGIGNNGGDGLVLARHLITHGYHVYTYVINCSDKRSKDFLVNYDRIKGVTKKWPTLLSCQEDFPHIQPDDIIVDAIFGIGLNRPVDAWLKALFLHFRQSKAFTLAIDIPSGLYMESPTTDNDSVVWANYTLSFASAKLVFFLPETAKYTLQWEVLDIGIDQDFLLHVTTEAELIAKHHVLPMYMPRDAFSHKGQFGHALIIGGSYGKIGAVTLASKAVLYAGAGLVSAYLPKCGYTPIQGAFPEAMAVTDAHDEHITSIHFDFSPTVIGIGMGLGTHPETVTAFEAFLKNNKVPLVIDADAINILAKQKALLKLIPEQSIFTPHPKELERLIGMWSDDFDKLKKVKAFSKTYNAVVVIKGAHTITVFQDQLYVNTTGNPGLATAGSGDVLTGIITGLIAQGYSPLTAAIFGVYLHGKSADIAVEDFGYQSLIASHVIDYLGKAFLSLFETKQDAEDTDDDYTDDD